MWFRLFFGAGALITTGLCRILRRTRYWPWTGGITTALGQFVLLPDPG